MTELASSQLSLTELPCVKFEGSRCNDQCPLSNEIRSARIVTNLIRQKAVGAEPGEIKALHRERTALVLDINSRMFQCKPRG